MKISEIKKMQNQEQKMQPSTSAARKQLTMEIENVSTKGSDKITENIGANTEDKSGNDEVSELGNGFLWSKVERYHLGNYERRDVLGFACLSGCRQKNVERYQVFNSFRWCKGTERI